MAQRKRYGPFPGAPPADPYLPDGHGETSQLRALLEDAPLYRRLPYSCRGPLRSLPRELELYCEGPKCGVSRLFTIVQGSTLEAARYRCVCSYEYRFFIVYERSHEREEMFVPSGGAPGNDWIYFEVGTAAKMGQWPPPSDRISKRLEKRLGEEAAYYRTAIRLRNFNAGLGAMSYMRRVVEHTVRELLSITAEEAKRQGISIDMDEFNAVVQSHSFDKKFEYAKQLLPAELIPGGHDPLNKLHAVCSLGVHELTEEQGVMLFDETRDIFEYFFEALPERETLHARYTKKLSEVEKVVEAVKIV